MGNSTSFYGLFDLRDDGMIFYSRDLAVNSTTRSDLVGRNFFEDICSIDNVSDFRLQFYQFVRSRKAVESFVIDCNSGNVSRRTKVLMARAYENENHSPHERVMLEIRESV